MSQYGLYWRLLACLTLVACAAKPDSAEHTPLGSDGAASPDPARDGEVDGDPARDGDAGAGPDADGGPNCPGADAAPAAPCSSCCCAFTCEFCTVPAASMCGGSSDAAEYGFESDTQGWSLADTSNTTIPEKTSVSTARAFAGNSSLEAQLSIPPGSEQYVRFQFSPAGHAPGPGDTVTFHVWVPHGAGIRAIQPYVMDAQFGWNGAWIEAGELVAGCWATVAVSLPPAFTTPAFEIGVQVLSPKGAQYDGTVYVDSVSW